MLLTILLLLAGLTLVVMGSNYLVDGACAIARRSGISEFVIGLTIVGIGTSTPEMVVSFISAMNGNSDMAIGNVIGSNIFNTFFILGATTIILPLPITRRTLKRDIPFNILSCLVLILLGFTASILHFGSDSIGRPEGFALLVMFALYMFMCFKGKQEDGSDSGTESPSASADIPGIPISIVMVIGGTVALIYGGNLFVDKAVVIAKALNISDKVIGITILALGTSLPEFATCIVAAFKRRSQLALGNIIGSNIANICLILGGSALINPLSMANITQIDLGFLTLAALFLLAAAFTFGRYRLDRTEGAFMLLLGIGYMYLLF